MASDFEDDSDGDYVPPDPNSPISDADEPDAKRPRFESSGKPIQQDSNNKARDQLWAEFQTASKVSPVDPGNNPVPTIVKIEKRYRFAGEDLVEVVEVDENSEEAKAWPRWHPPNTAQESVQTESPLPKIRANNSKRPGPRKPKTVLPSLPQAGASSQKPKQLTTLDKSAMDWRDHVNTSQDAEQLGLNRKGAGYLDKVDFLQRVEERKESILDASKSSKRRR